MINNEYNAAPGRRRRVHAVPGDRRPGLGQAPAPALRARGGARHPGAQVRPPLPAGVRGAGGRLVQGRSGATARAPLRPSREDAGGTGRRAGARPRRIALFVNDKHDIHHVHDRGYVEAPVRIARILAELDKTDSVRAAARAHPLPGSVRQVHDAALVAYMRKVCLGLPAGKSVYPYVFPIRNASRPPTELAMRAGYYCIDTFTPLNRNAFLAARRRGGLRPGRRRGHRQGPAPGLRPGAPAGPPRRAPRVRRLLLLQQHGHRRPRAGRAWARWRSWTWTTTTATGSRTSSTPATTC